MLEPSQISICITTLELLRGNTSIRNREDRYLILERQLNADGIRVEPRPQSSLQGDECGLFVYNFISRKQCEGHDSGHPSPDRKQGRRLRALQENDLDYHLQAIAGN